MNDFRDKHILLVEDEILIGQSERLMFEDAGYRCTLCTSGEKAIAFAAAHDDVDLVLMDLDLGRGMSGIETARRLREQAGLPIVFLSSQTAPELIAETETVASHGFIVKGSPDHIVLAQIRMAFRLSRARQGERESEARYRELFESSQVSLWLEDYSDAKRAVDRLKERGIRDIEGYYIEHFAELQALAKLVRVVRVNEATLRLYGAESEEQFQRGFQQIFPESCYQNFIATLGAIARGETRFEVSEDHRTIQGRPLRVHLRWSVLPGDNGMYRDVAVSVIDLTEVHEALSELERERLHFKRLFENAPVAIAVVDESERVLRTNGEFTNLFGYTEAEAVGKNIDDLITSTDARDTARALSRHVLDGHMTVQEHTRYRKDGGEVEVLISGAPLHVNGETYAFAMYQDIGARKEAEALATRLLEQKTTLLKESHHRIKNNMAVIEGLLRLRAHDTDGPAASVLEEAATRLHSMMLLYDALYRKERYGELNLREFLPPVVQEIIHLASGSVPVELDIDLVDINLDASVLSPLSIILNECISNSMKYAFVGRDHGRITVSACIADEALVFRYADNGTGFQVNTEDTLSKGFGLRLVSMLAEQIGARIVIEGSGGMRVTMTIPLAASEVLRK
ncbi:MAG: PAS domain S-box protein [bacterium]